MKTKLILVTMAVASLWATQVAAKVPAEKAAELDGKTYTCMGAERAGSPGGVPEYAPKYYKTWPGDKSGFGYEPGPYADEKPTVKITAANMAQYQDKLNDGQKALLKKYPNSFWINVYPSHREFKFADWVCPTVKKNATTAEVVHDGLGITGTTGAIPFPFPQNGLEAVWNMINPHRAWTEKAVCDIADVYANGSTAWGRNKFMTKNPGNDPKVRGSFQSKENINARFYTSYLLPERDK